jgi:hypothetical protein
MTPVDVQECHRQPGTLWPHIAGTLAGLRETAQLTFVKIGGGFPYGRFLGKMESIQVLWSIIRVLYS